MWTSGYLILKKNPPPVDNLQHKILISMLKPIKNKLYVYIQMSFKIHLYLNVFTF